MLIRTQGPDAACRRHHEVLGADCRDARNTYNVYPGRNPQRLSRGYECNANGLVCMNQDNRFHSASRGQPHCLDYEVRYNCAGRWGKSVIVGWGKRVIVKRVQCVTTRRVQCVTVWWG